MECLEANTINLKGDIMGCETCPYYTKQCEYGAEHIICSKQTKQKTTEKREVKTSTKKVH